MLGGSLFREMEDDPFFAMHTQHMRQMQSMFQNPFGGLGMGMPNRMLEPPRRSDNQGAVQRRRQDPFGDLMGGMGGFPSMFGNMDRMMGEMQRSFERASNDPNSHSFSQSSFYSYTNTGQGEPKVYQATSSTRRGPGGIKETRKAVKDSESGVEKMAVGHHIHDRGHVIEKSRNRKTSEHDEKQDFINLDEDEAPSFHREWQEKTRQQRQAARGLDYERRRDRSRQEPLALPPSRDKHRYRDRD